MREKKRVEINNFNTSLTEKGINILYMAPLFLIL